MSKKAKNAQPCKLGQQPASNTTFNFQEGYCADFVLALHKFLNSKDTCFTVLHGACKRGQVLIHCYLYSGKHESYFNSINYPNGTTIDEVEDRLDQWREIEQLEDPDAEAWLDYFEFRDFHELPHRIGGWSFCLFICLSC